MQEKIPVFYPRNTTAWRKWLEKNHQTKQSVWVVFYNKASGKKSLTWSDAVDVALCFGWIDSKKVKIDEETAHQFFTRRKPKSTWSKINKDKIKRLIKEGLMTTTGLEVVQVAKRNGSWTILDDVENLVIPEDLEKAFKKKKGSKSFFLSQSKTAKKIMLQQLLFAKRPETRRKRIDAIVALCSADA